MSESRYDGFPQVFLSGDKAKALEHLGRAKSLLSVVQKLRGHADVGVFQKSIQLEGVVITARSYGGINQIFVHADSSLLEKRVEEMYSYPVVLSGYVQARGYDLGQVDEEYLTAKRLEKIARVTSEFSELGKIATEEDLALTAEEEQRYSQPTGHFSWDEKTVRVYGGLLETTDTGLHKSSTLSAHAWGVNVALSGLMSLSARRDYKSYRFISGTLYTGALSKCAQMVLGLHRDSAQALTELPPFLVEDEEAARVYLLAQTVLPPSRGYVEQVVGNDGFCPQYESKWDKSDGLYKGLTGWWLIRVTRTNIYARRLPVYLGSDKPAFAEHYRKLELYSVADAVEFFGGLPTGEGFPTGEEFQQGLDQGWIQDITPAGMPFADAGWAGYYGYASWSFSPEGDQAHAVGYRMEGLDYYSKWTSIHFSSKDTFEGERLQARVVQQRRDEIFAPPQTVARLQYLPYKVPLQTMDGSVITVLLPTEDNEDLLPYRFERVYDAVVWVGYVGDHLQTLSYYYNPKTEPEKIESLGGFPEGITSTTPGSWEWGERKSWTSTPMCMYSSVWDTRQTSHTYEVTHKKTQKKLYEYWYYSTTEMGNALSYEWPIYSPVGYFYTETERMERQYAESFKTAAVAYMDRSVYSGATMYVKNFRWDRTHGITRFSKRGKWRAQGFLCEAWIWFQWRLPCAANPESVVRKYDAEYGRDLYISSCGQKCEWIAGSSQHDFRIMIICTEDYPAGAEEVTLPRFAKCTDVRGLNARAFMVEVDETGGEGWTWGNALDKLETKGWYVCPGKTNGATFHGFGEYEMESAMGGISPDIDTGEFHRVGSSRNCFGYLYEGYAKHLIEGPGYAKLGKLHAGDTEIPKHNIVFFGVLDE